MTKTHYLPGDRVQYINGGSLHIHHMIGATGTISENLNHEISDFPYVKWDNAAYSHGNYMHKNLMHWPVQISCHARWNHEGYTNHIGKVVHIAKGIALFENGARADINRIVCVAEPIFWHTGLDFASGPDWSGFHIHLKQAQKLAETLHAKHFNQVPNIWKVADNMTDVLLQIDHMTAGMVRSANQAQAAKTYSNVTDFAHWLANMMNVPVDANECLNVARHMILEQRTKTKAIDRLAEFIMSEIPGEPSQSEGAVDTAIRIMKEQKKALQIAENARLDVVGERNDAYGAIHQAARRLAKWVKDAPAGYGTDESRVWLAKYAPEYVKPVFKRGDLVTWGVGVAPMGRIVGPGVLTDTLEVICLHEGCEGQFRDIYSSALRLIAC